LPIPKKQGDLLSLSDNARNYTVPFAVPFRRLESYRKIDRPVFFRVQAKGR
jgi:hypothetical protein